MSVFANAKVLKPTSTAKAKSKKVEIHLDHLEDYALIDALITNLESVKASLGDDVKNQAREIFLQPSDKKPENFRGIDGSAEASVELRKRSTRSILSDDEVAALEQDGIPYETVEDVSETFVINPAYAADSKLLGSIEKALKGVKGLPADFILRQEGVSRRVVSDETVNAVFAKGLARKFIDTVALIALKPKLENPNLKAAIDLAKKFVA